MNKRNAIELTTDSVNGMSVFVTAGIPCKSFSSEFSNLAT